MPRFDHVAVQVRDMDVAIDFYVEKLDFTLKSRNLNEQGGEEYTFLSLGDLSLELLRDLTRDDYCGLPVEHPYCPHLAIEVEDMGAAVRKLEAAGVAIAKGPLRIEGEATWMYFADPDNNALEFIQWLKEA